MTALSQSFRFERRPAVLGLLVGIVVLCLLLAAAGPALRSMITMWSQEEYSHAWLIGPLAGLIFVERFSTVPRRGGTWFGVLAAGLAVVLILAGWATRNTTLSIDGCIAGIFAMVWAAVGHRAMRTVTAPIAFLLFMIPLPLAAYVSLSQWMQLVRRNSG